jgi:hypothetical protein
MNTDYSNFSDCKVVSTILFRNCCNTKITKQVHVNNSNYLYNIINNVPNKFVVDKLKIIPPTTYFTIYLMPECVRYFINVCLVNITKPFVIVSGSSDLTTPRDILSNTEMLNFLEDSRVIHWYGQNVDFVHKKVTNIPIGLDYHSLLKPNVLKWHDNVINCNSQELMLSNIVKNSKPFNIRLTKCYANFHIELRSTLTNDRVDAVKNIDRAIIFYEPFQINRKTFWENQSNYKFAVCPHGGGYDTHRLWECLVLGCIAIVKTSALDVLYKDLPVVIVNKWSDITNELLISESEKYTITKYNYDKLTAKYWITKIYSHT